MAKKETHPIAPTPDQLQETQGDAPPGATNLGVEVLQSYLTTPIQAQTVAESAQVNRVDTLSSGTGIVLSSDQDVPDATTEEPTYPVHEWWEPADPPLVLPSEMMSDDELVANVLHLQGRVVFKLRRMVQDSWVLGKNLCVLFERHGVDRIVTDSKTGKTRRIRSRWRAEWLPKLQINHTSDQRLRVLATNYAFEEVARFATDRDAFQACGFSIGGVTKAIEQEKSGTGQGRDRSGLAQHDGDNVVAGTVTRPRANQDAATKVDGKPQPTKTATKVASWSAEVDPIVEDKLIAESEALVVTLSGTSIAEMEAALQDLNFAVVHKAKNRVVGLLWYGDEEFDLAKERVARASKRLRAMKNKLQIEARCLMPVDVFTV